MRYRYVRYGGFPTLGRGFGKSRGEVGENCSPLRDDLLS